MTNWFQTLKISQNNNLVNDLAQVISIWLDKANEGMVDANSVYQDIDVKMPGMDDESLFAQALQIATGMASSKNSMGLLSGYQNTLIEALKTRFNN